MARPSAAELAEGVLAGSRPDIARAITMVESQSLKHRPMARELLSVLRPYAGRSTRVGVTGVPGAGKSTFIDAMGMQLIEQGHRVAVLAVDPSSSRTGGSILGDRTRMAQLANSDAAFVRPSPSSGHLGGVARATRESMVVVEAAGYDVVLVETVGVGQSEVAVAEMVDTFLLLTLARSGDQLQGIKRGILELADVIVVNKADGEHEGEARVAARELSIAMKLINSDPNAHRPPVLTSSSVTGIGLESVWQAVAEHRDLLEAEGLLLARRDQQQIDWLWAMVRDELAMALKQSHAVQGIAPQIEREIVDGSCFPLEGAQRILEAFRGEIAAEYRQGQ